MRKREERRSRGREGRREECGRLKWRFNDAPSFLPLRLHSRALTRTGAGGRAANYRPFSIFTRRNETQYNVETAKFIEWKTPNSIQELTSNYVLRGSQLRPMVSVRAPHRAPGDSLLCHHNRTAAGRETQNKGCGGDCIQQEQAGRQGGKWGKFDR